jgi:beta-lactamase regulating signal transducer with metallopeptidase domain
MNILQMSVSAGLLIAVVALIRAVALHRLPKTMFLILWGAALFRLIIPFSIPLSIPLRYGVYNAIYNAIENIAKAISPDNTVPSAIDGVISGAAGTAARITEAARERAFYAAPATIVWLAGMVGAFIFFASVYFKSRRVFHHAPVIRDNDYLNEWLAERELLRPITIAESDATTTPLAVGWIKPRIILPKSMDMSDERLLSCALNHEYYHIKRCDALWKALLVFALCVHWFNPMVWVMLILANRDLELTCDEMVIRRFGAETKTSYACALIGLAEQRSKFAPFYNGFSGNATEERIISIMKFKKSSVAAISLATVLVIGITAVFVTSAKGVGYALVADTPLLGGGRLEAGRTDDSAYTSISSGFERDPAKIRDGRIYFTLDGSDTEITNYCSEKNYYQYERIADDGYRHVVLIGGAPADIGWAEFIWNENGAFAGSAANYNGEREPAWLRLGREALAQSDPLRDASLSELVPVNNLPNEVFKTDVEIKEENETSHTETTDGVELVETDSAPGVEAPVALFSVSRDDEGKFTEEAWKDILAQIDKSELFWED